MVRDGCLAIDDVNELDQIVLGVAHELNNPNTYVRLAAINLRELFALMGPVLHRSAAADPNLRVGPYSMTELETTLDQQIAAILAASLRIHTIAERLKDVTSPREMGRVEVPLAEVVTEVVANHRFLFADCGEIVAECVDARQSLVLGSRLQLEQALSILITNARDAIVERNRREPGRRGKVTVGLRRDGDVMELTVADDGCGMDQQTQQRAFQLYFTTKEKGAGEGLGLALCASILARHGGKISMSSAEGQGTTMMFTIPASGATHGF